MRESLLGNARVKLNPQLSHLGSLWDATAARSGSAYGTCPDRSSGGWVDCPGTDLEITSADRRRMNEQQGPGLHGALATFSLSDPYVDPGGSRRLMWMPTMRHSRWRLRTSVTRYRPS